MKQLSFSDAEYAVKRKQTQREVFPAEMDKVVPWAPRRPSPCRVRQASIG